MQKDGKKLLSWRVQILPYIDQDGLYKKFKLDEPWDSEHNKKVLEENLMPPVYALPGLTKPGEKATHLQVFVGNGAFFDADKPTAIKDVTDGTSNTIMAVNGAKAVPWTKPADIEFDPKADPKTSLLLYDDGYILLFADGSVRFASKNITADTLRKLITRAGGEVVDNRDF
ncbi:hypothetical protein FRUB_05462 [Fimbriiglobus ruber]|uniref:DUF1559 domain-containing protein n=1 Tax=Fimbriiglobus ruber TaxID=1908690 RepID=A0A225DHS4_9BACT|nr:hypothetical protein FRUB_05462 [Fimbriiglobus ruber]